MQISSYNSTNFQNNQFTLQDINQNLTLNEKQALRKALMQIPSKDLPKVLQKIKQIPINENYLKNVIQTIENEKQYKKEGFEIYA
jgi:membrane-bound ClpP family serine protease